MFFQRVRAGKAAFHLYKKGMIAVRRPRTDLLQADRAEEYKILIKDVRLFLQQKSRSNNVPRLLCKIAGNKRMHRMICRL